MKHKLVFLTLFILSAFMSVFSQDFMSIADSMQGAKFSEITDYLDQLYVGKDTIKGSGWKPYERWKHEQMNNLDSKGYLINGTRKTWDLTYSQTKSSALKGTGSFQGNWNSFGTKAFKSLSGSDGGHGRVNCIVADPDNNNILYAGTPAGGLWRSTDAGDNWMPLTDGMPNIGISGIVIDPSSPIDNRTIYVLSGDGDGSHTYSLGVFKSIDNGATWYLTDLEWTDAERVRSWKLVLKPGTSNDILSATDEGIHRTTDGGLSWTNCLAGKEIVDIEFNTENSEIIYASSFNGEVFRSIDGGANWNQLDGSNGLPVLSSYNRVAIAVTPNDPNYVYAYFGKTVAPGQFTGMYLSTDGGDSFTLQSNTPNISAYSESYTSDQTWYDLAIAVSPEDKNTVYAGGIYLWVSTDAGVTWTRKMTSDKISRWGVNMDMHVDIHALDYINDVLYCGNDGGLSFLDNSTDLWHDISSTLEITQLYKIGDDPIQPDVVHGGAQDNGSNKFQGDTIYHWEGGDGCEVFAHPTNTSIFYGSWQRGQLTKTENGGLSTRSITPLEATGGQFIAPFMMDPNDSETLYAGYRDLFRSTDAGNSWENISSNITNNTYNCYSIAVAPSNSEVIYLAKGGTLYKTTDGGLTWNSVFSGFLIDIEIHPFDENKLWITESNAVHKSIDGSNSWTNITNDLPGYELRSIVYQKGSYDRIYAGTDGGVFFTDNARSGWTEFNDGLVKISIRELEINDATGKLRAATFGRGIWESDLYFSCDDESVVSVAQPLVPASLKAGVGTLYTIEAETFVETGSTYDDSYAGGPGFGVNRAAAGINYVNTTDWAVYNLPSDIESGLYTVTYQISTPSDNAAISLSLDNGATLLSDNVPNNGQWDVYGPLQASGQITIENGVNSTLKVTASGSNAWQWNLDKIELTKVGELDTPVTGVSVSDTVLSIESGSNYQLSATIEPTDATNTNISWSSSDESIATVDASGYVSAISEGVAIVTVTTEDGGHTAISAITVFEEEVEVSEIQLSETAIYIDESATSEITATVLPVNATDKTITWSSSNEAVATVSQSGIVEGIAAGEAIIAATSANGLVSASCTVTVEESYSVTIEAETGMAIFGSYETYSANGITAIRVNSGQLISYALPNSLQKGKYRLDYYIATAKDDVEMQVTGLMSTPTYIDQIPNNGDWESFTKVTSSTLLNIDRSQESNLLIRPQGTDSKACHIDKMVLTRVGDYYIPVEDISISPNPVNVEIGTIISASAQVTPQLATDAIVTWSIEDESIATISFFDNTCFVDGISLGTTTLTASSADGSVVATAVVNVIEGYVPITSIEIIPDTASVLTGDSIQFSAVIEPENATNKNVEWISTNNSIAEINAEGTAKGKRKGTTTIRVSVNDNGNTKFANAVFEVLPIPVNDVFVTPSSVTLPIGNSETIIATVLPENADNKSVQWNTNNPLVAIVDEAGTITAISEGVATITATTVDGGFTATTEVTVKDPNRIVIEAEGFATTGGTVNDANWGGPGYGVNNAGSNINWVNTGDWATYPLTIYRSGKYRVDYNISTPNSGAAIELSIDDVAYMTDNVPNNGEWDAFQLFTAGKILQFEPGDYTLKVKGVGTDGWEWNLEKIELVKVGEACYTSMSTPELKQANVLTGFYKGKLEGIIYESDELENEDISEANNHFSIYPNPTSSQFTISFNVESNQPASIQIRNILGELQAVVVDGEILEEGKYELNYNVENLVSGMYLVTFSNGITNEVRTLVIE